MRKIKLEPLAGSQLRSHTYHRGLSSYGFDLLWSDWIGLRARRDLLKLSLVQRKPSSGREIIGYVLDDDESSVKVEPKSIPIDVRVLNLHDNLH